MKMPKSPPDWTEELKKITPDRLVAIIQTVGGPSHAGKYSHWDKLIRYKTPDGFSHEEWWLGLKFHRIQQYKEIALVDRSGLPFQFLVTDPIPEQLHLLDQSAGGSIEIPEQITSPETRDRYIVQSLMAEAITSSQLEGAVTTRQVAKEMIRKNRKPRDKSEQMILNNFLTMKQITKLKDAPLTKDLVLEIHKIVTDKTLDDPSAMGRFRRADEVVVVDDMYGEVFHEPPHAGELEHRINTMCDFANGKTPGDFLHPALRSIILHFWLSYDHPFIDGNGRTARALFYWSMLHYGFWLFEFISISQIIRQGPSKYGRAFLHVETDDNDLTYFILYHLEVIQRAIDELNQYVIRKTKQLQLAESSLRDLPELNHRQRALISHAIRHPHQRYTFMSHSISNNVTRQTARTDLFDLRDRGLLVATKVGRAWNFTPAENLESKLNAGP